MAATNEETYFMEKENPTELERLAAQHATIKNFLGGKLVLANLDLSKPGLRILDSGTADGLWLRDLQFSTSTPQTYIGTDLTESYFPPKEDIPTGINLFPQSITKPWPKDWADSFDLVHQRFVFPAAGEDFIRQSLVNLIGLAKPEGWVQFIEADHSVFSGKAMGELFRVVQEVFGAMNIAYDHAKDLKVWCEEAGLVEVQERILDMPLGISNKDPVARANSTKAFTLGIKGIVGASKAVPTTFSDEWADGLLLRINDELSTQGGVYRVYCVWGKKPEGHKAV